MYKKDEYKIRGEFSTNIGNVRNVNQDSIFFRNKKQHGISFAVGAVCDGIGGLDRGEVASGILVKGIEQWYESCFRELDFRIVEPDILFSHLLDAAEEWNRMILEVIETCGFRTGSTMSVIMIFHGKYYILQVGDSRIYHYRNTMEQLTEDDTNYKIRDGKMKGFLANHMGKREQLEYTTVCGDIEKDSFYFCCSDGFYHRLEEADIAQLYGKRGKHPDYGKETAQLILKMMERGEKDNSSFGVIHVE